MINYLLALVRKTLMKIPFSARERLCLELTICIQPSFMKSKCLIQEIFENVTMYIKGV